MIDGFGRVAQTATTTIIISIGSYKNYYFLATTVSLEAMLFLFLLLFYYRLQIRGRKRENDLIGHVGEEKRRDR